MANKHTKRCSSVNSYFSFKKGMLNIISHFGKCKSNTLKNVVRYHFTLARMAIIKKMENKSFGKDVEKLQLSGFAGRNVKWYSLYGKQF